MASNIYMSKTTPDGKRRETYTTWDRWPGVLRDLEAEHGPVVEDHTCQASSGHWYRFEDGTTLETGRSY